MRTERSASPTENVVVVCPTEYGGQLEHAADLALALHASPETGSVWLVSRPGAREYLGWELDHPVRIVESVPPRRTDVPSSRTGKLVRAGLQVVDLLREHAAVRAVASRAGHGALLALDSTKYPAPALLCAHRDQRTVVFVHNAQPHFDQSTASVRERVLLWLERSCSRHADGVITHGDEQARIVRGYTQRPVAAVRLPISSRLDPRMVPVRPAGPGSPYALCIGEVRANKGTELAMIAAGQAGVPLLVRGAAESPELADELHRIAQRYPTVDFEDRFLDRDEFAGYIHDAAIIVLPYTHFDAHSGVLSKAMGVGTPVVASDLPSLRAQAGDYPAFTGADPHDAQAFGRVLRTEFDAAVAPDRAQPGAETDKRGTTAPVTSAPSMSSAPRTSNGHDAERATGRAATGTDPAATQDYSDWEPSVAAVLHSGRP